MTPSKINKHDNLSKSPATKSQLNIPSPSNSSPHKPSPTKSPVSKRQSPISKLSPTPSPKPADPLSSVQRKASNSPATQRKLSATPKSPLPSNPTALKLSATPNTFHLTPPGFKPFITPQPAQPQRKFSTTPKPNLSPQPTQPRKLSATPPQPTPRRKSSATLKPLSPPKPNWIAPPGKHCIPSPTQIPLPVFGSSVRKDVSASPELGLHVGKGISGCYTPVSMLRRRRSGVVRGKMGSPLVCEISGGEETAALMTKESGEGTKNEIKGLGLSFKDPFSSTLGFESGSGSGIISAVSGIPDSGQTTPRVKNFGDVGEAASPISPRPRIYTPTATSTTTASLKRKEPGSENTADVTQKRDSLSPDACSFTPTSISSTIAIPATKSPSSSKPISRIPHLRSPTSTLPPSPSTVHPYTGNTHITPSCTSGALTHRLVCGHMVVTERVEVCGRNCGYSEGKGNGRGGREEGFAANIRDLDQVWGCPCCGSEVEKGRRCDAVLDEKFQ